MFVGFLLFVFIQQNWSRAQEGPCRDHDKGCCFGTIWNVTLGKCTDCNPGYTGPGCRLICEYPYYGMQCMGMCTCTNNSCNFMTGCQEHETSMTIDITRSSFQSITNEAKRDSREKSKSTLISGIIIFGSLGIGICILFACFYVYKMAIENQFQQRTQTSIKSQNGHYEQVDRIAFHI